MNQLSRQISDNLHTNKVKTSELNRTVATFSFQKKECISNVRKMPASKRNRSQVNSHQS